MYRKDIFNLQHPQPLDKSVYPVYDRYLELQAEIVKNWKTEVINGMMGDRHYQDLNDCRISITKDGKPIVRLVPVIGFDTQDELKFFHDFFDAYKKLSINISLLLTPFWMSREREMTMDGYTSSLPDHVPYRKRWGAKHDQRLHKLVMTLKILIALMNTNKLDPNDLYRFTDVINDENGEFVDSMDQLIRDSDLSEAISSEFIEGKAHFYQYPDCDLVQAYWVYARKSQERIAQSIHNQMVKSGFNAKDFVSQVAGRS